MRFLQRFWPWREFQTLEVRIAGLTEELRRERAFHGETKKHLHFAQECHKEEISKHKETKQKLEAHATTVDKNMVHMRKMATALAIQAGISISIFLISALSCFGQAGQRNLFTTNPPPLLSVGSGPLLTTNGAGIPIFTYDGGSITNLNTNTWSANAFNWVLNLVSNASLNASNHDWVVGAAITNGGINNLSNYVNALGAAITNGGVTQLSNYVNQVALNITNQGTVVSNGVVAHTVTVAGTANQITSSVGTAQTIAANPATTLSLPSPTIFPGQISVVGITNASGNSNSVAIYDAKTNLTYLATGSGAVTNNGSGVMGYYNGFADGANLTNGAINNLSNLVATVGANDTNNASTKQIDLFNPGNYGFIEEFDGHGSGDLTTGEHRWRVLGVGSGSSSVTLNAAAAVHPGMITLTPGGTVSGGMLIMVNGTTNSASDLLLPANTLPIGGGNSFTVWTNRWIFRTGSATNDMKCWIGMVNNIVYGNAKPADFIGVELDTTNNVNIQYISGASSTYTNVSGPLIAVSTWYDFVMYSTVNGTINFYINNANAGVINTSGNISTLGLNFLGDVWKTATSSQATMTFDYCSFVGLGTAR